MSQQNPLIKLQKLGCERSDRPLFADLSAEFKAGQLVQILGPNGSGKTTLLRILAGLSSDYQGDILWRNQAVSEQQWDFRNQLLYLGHATAIKKNLSPVENLAWYAAARNFRLTQEAAFAALAKVNLSGFEDYLCYQLSAGQQRRVALARLVLAEQDLWILDEPFTALDKEGVKVLEGLIANQLSRGGLVIMTSHQDLQSLSAETIDLRNYPPVASHLSFVPFGVARSGGLGD